MISCNLNYIGKALQNSAYNMCYPASKCLSFSSHYPTRLRHRGKLPQLIQQMITIAVDLHLDR